MAKYNEWLTLSDLESIPGLPEWIKKSISGNIYHLVLKPQ